MNAMIRERNHGNMARDAFERDAFTCDALRVPSPILGVDASVAKAGFALVWGDKIKAWKFTAKKKGIERMMETQTELVRILALYRPRMAMIEGYSLGSRNSQSHSTGEMGGMIRLVMAEADVHIAEAAPTTLKKFLSGKGNTPKTGMPLALYKSYGVDYADEDQADAAGLALLGAAHFGGHERKLYKYQEDALKKITTLWNHHPI